MRRGVGIALAVVGVAVAAAPSLALAQSEFESPAMPDPRQMSGVVRAEPNDPPGTLTVRVIQGSIVMNAPAGTAVQLVAVHAGGTADKQVGRLDDQGRVQFRNLKRNGSVAYHVMTVLRRGEVEDRLMAQTIVMPPQVGLRVMLAGHAPDSTEPAIDDLLEGTPGTPPGAGDVLVGIRGDLPRVREVHLLEVGRPEVVAKAKPVGQGQMKVARFQAVVADPERAYVVAIPTEGQTHVSQPFQLTSDRGAAVNMLVWQGVLFGFHGFGQVDEERLWFEMQFALWNPSSAPYDPGPDGLLIPLPKGFVPGSVDEQMAARVVLDRKRGFVWQGAIAPGQHEFIGTFAVPIDDGRAVLDMPMPLGALEGQLMFSDAPGLTISKPPGATERTHDLEDGRKLRIIEKIATPPQSRLRVDIAGLPTYPKWRKYAGWAAAIATVLLLAWGAAGIFGRRARTAAGVEEARGIQDLILERERLYDRLVHVEKQRRAGKLPDTRYQRMRTAAVRELEAVYARLDAARRMSEASPGER